MAMNTGGVRDIQALKVCIRGEQWTIPVRSEDMLSNRKQRHHHMDRRLMKSWNNGSGSVRPDCPN
jgi:hypothetical protein